MQKSLTTKSLSDKTMQMLVHPKKGSHGNYTIEEKRAYLEEAIRNGGFYGDAMRDMSGVRWNSIMVFDSDDHIYRGRVETLIIRDKKEVFLKFYPKDQQKDGCAYCIPGGSMEKDVDPMSQAVNECNEEALIKVSNIRSTGLTYKEHREPPKWCLSQPINWNGYYNEVYVADYDGPYRKKVEKADLDKFTASGHFYPIRDVFKVLKPVHQEALKIMYPEKFKGNEWITEAAFLHKKRPQLSYSLSYKDELKVLKQLPPEELALLGMDEGIPSRPSNDSIYRECLCIMNKPVAFIEVIQTPSLEGLDAAKVLLAVIPEYNGVEMRRHGYAKILVKKMMINLNRYKGHRRKPVRYLVWKNGTIVSNTLAENLGFKKINVDYQYDLRPQFPDGRLINEKALTSKERNKLHDSTFGIPELRKYPLNDREHVILAIKYYHWVEEKKDERKYANSLARNIFEAMEKFGISKDRIGVNNPLHRKLSMWDSDD